MMLERDFIGELTPSMCKKGPIRDRPCTDFFCFVIYISLISFVVALALLSFTGVQQTQKEIHKVLKHTQFGGPLYAIRQAIVPIILSLALIVAICMIYMITSLIKPIIAIYIYLPLLFLLILFGAIVFILRFFGIILPGIPDDIQTTFGESYSKVTLVIGVGFVVGLLATIFVILLKKARISYIEPVLRMARSAFWHKPYILITPFIFTILSIGALLANVGLIAICLTRKGIFISPSLESSLILIQGLWTHGFIEALSSFFFQSIAIHWYFQKARQFQRKQVVCGTLLYTVRLIVKHIGTITFGHILAFIPQVLNNLIGRLEKNKGLYLICCFWHSYTVRMLSSNLFFQTILQGFDFCTSSKQMFGLRQRSKKALPNIYLIGSFFTTIVKTGCISLGVIVCYFLIQHSDLNYLTKNWNFLGPLVIVFLGSLQISSHFLNLIGLVGDTLTFAISVDIEIQKKEASDPQPCNCPDRIRDIIYEVRAGKNYIK